MEVCKDDKTWLDAAWAWMHRELKPGQRVFVPAGGTPTPLYRRWCLDYTDLLKSLTLVQIDDILNGPQKGTFKRFFESELGACRPNIEFIENADKDADAAILGVGVNGHVAFHEPRLPKDFTGGCVPLSDETLGYLHLDKPTWGVTYGVASFLKCKRILVLAQGERKRQILQQALKRKDLPISWVLEHPNVTLITNFDL